MIVKYKTGDTWSFIDNVRQVAHKDFSIDRYVYRYDTERLEGMAYDPVEYSLDGEKLPERIAKVNKAFCTACDDLADEGINRHAENLLMSEFIDDVDRGVSILLYIEECKEYDAVLLVTKQSAYLMNDKGQTIERLN
jgi:hypothetical protein